MLREKNQVLTKVYNRRGIDAEATAAEYLGYGQRLERYVADTGLVLNQALDEQQGGPARGRPGHPAGRGPRHLPVRDLVLADRGRRLRRLGRRADPDHQGDRDRQGLHHAGRRGPVPHRADRRPAANGCARPGGEYGVTTGRPRRTGWFDAVIARYATRVNGITDYFLTKLDVLSGLEQVPVCVAYDVNGTRHDEIPMTQTDFHHAMPVYEYLDGWWEDISSAKDFDGPPAATPRPTCARSRT